jgi:hypothetical protein
MSRVKASYDLRKGIYYVRMRRRHAVSCLTPVKGPLGGDSQAKPDMAKVA